MRPLALLAALALALAAPPARAQDIGPDTARACSPLRGSNLVGCATVSVKIRAKRSRELVAFRVDERSPVRPPSLAKGASCRAIGTSAPLIYRSDTLLWARQSALSVESEVWCVSNAVTVHVLSDSGTVMQIYQRQRNAALGLRVVAPPALPRGARISREGNVLGVAKDPALAVMYTHPQVIGASDDSSMVMFQQFLGPAPGESHPRLVQLSLGNFVHTPDGRTAVWGVSVHTNFLAAYAYPANSATAAAAPRLVFTAATPSVLRIVSGNQLQCLKIGTGKLRVRWTSTSGATTYARDSAQVSCRAAS